MSKVALVTGSSRGMGKAEILEFAKRGYDVIIHYVGNEAKAQAVKEEAEKTYDVKAAIVQADLLEEAGIEKLAKEALSAFGHVDVLVNNAGYAIYHDFSEKTITGFDEMMKIHVYAPFYLTKLLAPKMAENKFGRIINIGSIDATKTCNAESAEYDAAKAAVINLTRNCAYAYKPYVNVNCVCPGFTNTDMSDMNPSDLEEYMCGKICKGRFAKPEEIAKVVAFLASEDAEYIDGEVITVDGGYSMI